MKDNDVKNQVDELLQMVNDCEQRCSQLNDWEVNFIDSISRALGNDWPLSKCQRGRLEQIWERVTEKG